MTSLPSQDQMSPEAKAARKQQLDVLNEKCDQALGRSKKTPWYSEAGLSKETKAALDATEQKKPVESKLTYKISESMEARLKAADDIIHDRPAPRAAPLPILSMEERLRAWHRAIGSRKEVIDYEVAQLKKQQEGKT
jgi:hypothetical protein